MCLNPDALKVGDTAAAWLITEVIPPEDGRTRLTLYRYIGECSRCGYRKELTHYGLLRAKQLNRLKCVKCARKVEEKDMSEKKLRKTLWHEIDLHIAEHNRLMAVWK